MLLDRGELKDWFNSTEIWVEAMVSSICFYLFIIRTVTAGDRSFINRDLLKSPNFMAGTVLMFFIGDILSGTLALLPTMLQSLMMIVIFSIPLLLLVRRARPALQAEARRLARLATRTGRGDPSNSRLPAARFRSTTAGRLFDIMAYYHR